MRTLIATLLCCSLCGLLVACRGPSSEPAELAGPSVSRLERIGEVMLERKDLWRDNRGNSHYFHVCDSIRRVVDSTGTVTGTLWHCVDDSAMFILPATPQYRRLR